MQPNNINNPGTWTLEQRANVARFRLSKGLPLDGLDGVLPPAEELALRQQAALREIDTAADQIYGDMTGRRGDEYQASEEQAKAFAAAGYAGAAGPMVQSWASIKGWSAQQAADDILTQANAWRAAMAQIRAKRLGAKEAVRAAQAPAGVSAAMDAWTAFVAQIRGALGV